MFKKIRKGRKILIRTITFRCVKCSHYFDISDETFNTGSASSIPYGAKSSSGTLICEKCNSTEFTVFPKYEWLYRRRCNKCGEMFETPFSWEYRCEPCQKAHIEAMCSFGR